MDPTPQVKAGWLQKRGALGLRTWAKRWFEADRDGVTYYVDESKKESRGNIKYQDITSVEMSHAPLELFSSNGGYFQLITNKGGRIYFLYSDSKEDAKVWMDTICNWKALIGLY